jgi:hypothetical protein
MKRCPSCNRTYTDVSLNFCLEDGTPLISDAAPSFDPHATIRYTQPPTTSAPPPTEIYRPEQPLLNKVPEVGQPRTSPSHWGPTPYVQPQKKSNAVWWIVGGVLVVGIIGIGLIIILLALASIGSNENSNAANSNSRVANRNANANRTANTNTGPGLPRSFTEDFSSQRWTTGNFQFGDIWYSNGEYHMRAKDRTYLVMHAPSDVYNTENATVRVTARSVDGTAPVNGYGLIVHARKTPNNELEDYALLIYTGNDPKYGVIMHKANNQTTLVPWTQSSAILSGSNPNQLEIRTKGDQLSFYANGRYLTRITDSENFRRGLAGFYTSEASEVAFDNLEIER